MAESLVEHIIAIARRSQAREYEPYRFSALATYNSERGRGIVHTPSWQAFMAEEQADFDREMAAKYGSLPNNPANSEPSGLTETDNESTISRVDGGGDGGSQA